MKHVVSVVDVGEDIAGVLETAQRERGRRLDTMSGRTLALLFEKPSLRTRVSFEIAMRQLGGDSLYLSPAEVQMGVREPIVDVAKVLSRYVDLIAYRGFSHAATVELAKRSSIPVINALDDTEHPCQALADLMTIRESKGSFDGRKLAFVGDGNNVCNSLMLACPFVGLDLAVATPSFYGPRAAILDRARAIARDHGTTIDITTNPDDAVAGADAVYTDTWVSMGNEEEKAARLRAFRPYQVDDRLMDRAKRDAIFLHCLPAHREEEVTAEVIDGPRSIVYAQSENRLHVQKALIMRIFAED
ncbi:MAG: ornithine carbamoyltransferase [Thermoplasmata archaeon]|nr:ornithine carbamoyltransferase [Thermoplasmata archaeon]